MNDGDPTFALEDVWNWAPVPTEQMFTKTEDPYPLAIDPAALSYYSGLVNGPFRNVQTLAPPTNFGHSPSPMDILGISPAPVVSTLNTTLPYQIMPEHLQPPQPSFPMTAVPDSTASTEDYDIVSRSIAAAKVFIAVAPPEVRQGLSQYRESAVVATSRALY